MYRLLNVNDVSKTEYDYYHSLMSEGRKKRVELLHFEKDKKLSVCGEMLARKMLAEYCCIPPESIKFSTDENGKPFAENLNVCFNISHSGDYVLCAVSDKNIGADIELMRDIDDKLISYVCCEEELNYVYETGADKEKRFFEIWTAKEAYFKCIGTGITELKSVSVFDNTVKDRIQTFYHGDYAISICE
jgi:4'-phosphopantetheinyl transferase